MPDEKLNEIRTELDRMPAGVIILSDLCGVSVVKRELMAEIFRYPSEWLIIGCYARAMNLILEQMTGKSILQGKIQFINSETTSMPDIKTKLNEYCAGMTVEDSAGITEITDDSGWPSWYPVIDYSRCTNCGQCAEFCLFSVYEKKSEKVKVIFPQGCKNQCAACARICSSTAIIFPKYKNGGAIGGEDYFDENEELIRREADIKKFLGDDLELALRNRQFKRNSIIREEASRKAIEEREKFLLKNKEDQA